MTADAMVLEMNEAKRGLSRCKCGSNVSLHYEPGCTFIRCIREDKTVFALPDWQPSEIKTQWNNQR